MPSSSSYLPKASHTFAGGPALLSILVVTSVHLLYSGHTTYHDFSDVSSKRAEVVALNAALRRMTYSHSAAMLAAGLLNAFVALYCKVRL